MAADRSVCSYRTLSTYFETFPAAGFTVEGIKEPIPNTAQVTKYPALRDDLRVPIFNIYLLRNPAN